MARWAKNLVLGSKEMPASSRTPMGQRYLSDLYNSLSYGGQRYWPMGRTSYDGKEPVVSVGSSGAYCENGVAFAVAGRRVDLFCQVEWALRKRGAGPKAMAADLDLEDPALEPLAKPIKLNSRMEVQDTVAGNSFVVSDNGKVRVLEPQWCTIVAGSNRYPEDPGVAWDAEPVGLIYLPMGRPANEAEVFTWSEVGHYAPKEDPEARWRGMSWLRPVLSEVSNTNDYNRFITKYWQNNATPNTAVVFPPEVVKETVEAFKDFFLEKHQGVERAFRTLFLGGGADIKTIGANLSDLAAKDVTADGFAKICGAGGVPPVVVTIVPGLESASTYANYASAMRAFADLTVRPLWTHAALALEKVIKVPTGMQLWPYTAGISALQQDALDDAEVSAKNAQTIRTLGDGGWDKTSARDAVMSGDFGLLVDTGLTPVQLIPPGLAPAEVGAG